VDAVTLDLIAWILMRISRRLLIGICFSVRSALIAVLAIAIVGKGMATLQEAGWIAVIVAPVPHIELLGISLTWQSLLAQLTVVGVLAIGFVINVRRGRQPMHSSETAENAPPDA
jgi:high-affinity iron transporter